jgi:general secretion pathway protein K
MTQRGFALVAVLWVLAALTALAGTGMMIARLGSMTTRNRVLLARAEWAREACSEILSARFGAGETMSRPLLDSIDLGRGTWCRASLDDQSGRLNLNTADRDVLVRLFEQIGIPPELADSVIAQRHRGPIRDARQVPGLDSTLTAATAPFVTTRGTGAVNVNAATLPVLRVLPGLTDEAVRLIVGRRAARPFHSTDEMAAAMSSSSRTVLLDHYADFVGTAAFAPSQLLITVEGGVRSTRIVARASLTAVAVNGRLAILRREAE